jgi:hypothetical protein
MLRNNEYPDIRKTIAICYEQAEVINLNQVLGIESGGTLKPDNDAVVSSYLTTNSYGTTIFNGKDFYTVDPLGETNSGSSATTVKFLYKPSGCLAGKTYELFIVLTPQL